MRFIKDWKNILKISDQKLNEFHINTMGLKRFKRI